MSVHHATRRRFLGNIALGGAAGFLGLGSRPAAAEPPLETRGSGWFRSLASARPLSTSPKRELKA